MTKRVDFDQDITAEACSWVARIESGNFSAADRAALKEWMRQSPRHAEEIKAVAALSMDLSVLTELHEPLAAEARGASSRFFARKSVAFAAMSLATLAICAIIYGWYFRLQAVHQFYATTIGEYRIAKLVDGSSVKLNTNSAIEIIYDGSTREVRLLQGEAFFDVAHDPSRPFLVYAGANVARAVGTAFSVRLLDDKTELIVTRGVVEFSTLALTDRTASQQHAPRLNGLPRVHPVLVKAGYELSSKAATPQEQIIEPTPAAQRWKVSWTEGLLDFSDTPLSDVVSEVNRHTTLHIEIADKGLSDVKFGGVFRVDDVGSLLDALPRVGVLVTHVSDNEVRLYSEHGSKRAFSTQRGVGEKP